jgi:HEAT repeat protein
VRTGLKVSTVRELSAAGPAADELSRHALPRVRAQAVRTLGVVGTPSTSPTVEAALDDPDVGVRMAAERAMTRLVERLDLPT